MVALKEKRMVLPKELEKRFERLYQERYNYDGACFTPGTKQADEVKALMVDLKKAGCFIARFEADHPMHDYSTYFYPASHTVYFDFFRKRVHGEQYLRIAYTEYEAMEGALNSGKKEIDLIYAGDDEYWRWVD